MKTSRELFAFFGWTLGITFLICWGPLGVLQIPGASVSGGAGPGIVPFIIGGFVPSLVGLALTAWTEGRAGLGRLFRRAVAFKFSVRWYLAILLINVAVGGVRLFVQWATGGGFVVSETLAAMLQSPVLWIAFAVQMLVLGPLSEEFGWRGYAQDRVTARFGALTGSLVLGAAWAVWHLPLFFIPGTSQSAAGQPAVQFLVYAVFVVSMTVVMTWLYHRTGRSLGAMILMHTLMPFVSTLVSFLMTPSLLDAVVQSLGYLVAAVAVVLTAGRGLGAEAVREARAA